MIDLSAANLPAEALPRLIKTAQYQPFRFPGGVITGAGLGQVVRGVTLRKVNLNNGNSAEIESFSREARNQARMYEDVLLGAQTALGGLAGLSVLDVASNAGYFCYRSMQMGASKAVGIDVDNYSELYDQVNRHLGTQVQYIRGRYDMTNHRIEGTEESFDVVFNIAFMCHSSDPTFLLKALAGKTKKALVLLSNFPSSNDYFVRYSPVIKKYSDVSFPTCFDANTEMSDSLLKLGLTDLGFKTITEIPKQDYWTPRFESLRAFVAIR